MGTPHTALTHGNETSKTEQSNLYSSLFLYCCDKNTLLKSSLNRKGLFQLTGHSHSLWWHQGVDSCKTLLTGSKVEVVRGCCSLACLPWRCHTRLSPPTLITNQTKCPQRHGWPQPNPMNTDPSLRFSSQVAVVCVKLTRMNQFNWKN